MPFRPVRKQPQFADLKGILSQSKQTDNALYQTVQVLVERLMQFQGITVDRLDQLQITLDELEGAIEGLEGGVIGNYYDAPLTDGNVDEADFIFANGECIIVQVPNVT
jgi:hypothetical protein